MNDEARKQLTILVLLVQEIVRRRIIHDVLHLTRCFLGRTLLCLLEIPNGVVALLLALHLLEPEHVRLGYVSGGKGMGVPEELFAIHLVEPGERR